MENLQGSELERRIKRTEWFLDARFGMFIHWGFILFQQGKNG